MRRMTVTQQQQPSTGGEYEEDEVGEADEREADENDEDEYSHA